MGWDWLGLVARGRADRCVYKGTWAGTEVDAEAVVRIGLW